MTRSTIENPFFSGRHGMSRSTLGLLTGGLVTTALVVMSASSAAAQVPANPFRTNFNWDKLQGRKIGVASGIKMDPDGKRMWILDRCGANGYAESDLDPIILVDENGKLVKSFGKGLL